MPVGILLKIGLYSILDCSIVGSIAKGRLGISYVSNCCCSFHFYFGLHRFQFFLVSLLSKLSPPYQLTLFDHCAICCVLAHISFHLFFLSYICDAEQLCLVLWNAKEQTLEITNQEICRINMHEENKSRDLCLGTLRQGQIKELKHCLLVVFQFVCTLEQKISFFKDFLFCLLLHACKHACTCLLAQVFNTEVLCCGALIQQMQCDMLLSSLSQGMEHTIYSITSLFISHSF